MSSHRIPTIRSTGGANSGLIHISFNQDVTCVAVGSAEYFSIYNIDPLEV